MFPKNIKFRLSKLALFWISQFFLWFSYFLWLTKCSFPFLGKDICYQTLSERKFAKRLTSCCSGKELTETTFQPIFQHISKNAHWKYGNQKSSSFCTVIQISLLIRQISVGIERATKFQHHSHLCWLFRFHHSFLGWDHNYLNASRLGCCGKH